MSRGGSCWLTLLALFLGFAAHGVARAVLNAAVMRFSSALFLLLASSLAACSGAVIEPETRGPGGLGLGSSSGSSTSVGSGSGSGSESGSGSGSGGECGDFVECPCEGLPVCVDGQWQCNTICSYDAGPPPYDAEPYDAQTYDAEPPPWDADDPDVILPPPPPYDAGSCWGDPPYCVGACGEYVLSFCDGDGNWACEPTPPCEPYDAGAADGWVGTLPP